MHWILYEFVSGRNFFLGLTLNALALALLHTGIRRQRILAWLAWVGLMLAALSGTLLPELLYLVCFGTTIALTLFRQSFPLLRTKASRFLIVCSALPCS
jgi:hypothetical protein